MRRIVGPKDMPALPGAVGAEDLPDGHDRGQGSIRIEKPGATALLDAPGRLLVGREGDGDGPEKPVRTMEIAGDTEVVGFGHKTVKRGVGAHADKREVGRFPTVECEGGKILRLLGEGKRPLAGDEAGIQPAV